jgi:hypothetical protein
MAQVSSAARGVHAEFHSVVHADTLAFFGKVGGESSQALEAFVGFYCSVLAEEAF